MYTYTVPDPHLEMRGGGAVIQTLRKGGGPVSKNIFRPFAPQSPLDPPLVWPLKMNFSTFVYENVSWFDFTKPLCEAFVLYYG